MTDAVHALPYAASRDGKAMLAVVAQAGSDTHAHLSLEVLQVGFSQLAVALTFA